MFVRVRGARVGDPLHEFDVSVAAFESGRHRYVVVDPEPVAKARPASFMPGVVRADSKKKLSTPAGDDPEGGN